MTNLFDEKIIISDAVKSICMDVARSIGRPMLGVTTCIQVERVRDMPEAGFLMIPESAQTEYDWALTEREIDWDRGGVMGKLTNIIASTGDVTHNNLHRVMRGFMWSSLHISEFGPSHCDETDCQLTRADDHWFVLEMVPEWRRRYLS